MIRLSYPFDKQEEAKDCGAACLSMIIKYYKGYLSMEKIRDLLKVNQSGTTAYHIIEGAKQIGFTAKGVKCTLDDINEDINSLLNDPDLLISKTEGLDEQLVSSKIGVNVTLANKVLKNNNGI